MSGARRTTGPAKCPTVRSSDIPTDGRLLAVDWGEKRIGLAVSDPTQTLAQPLATLTRRSGKRFPMRQLKQYLDEFHPSGIVIGIPLGGDGGETVESAAARRAGELIAEKTGLPVTCFDERMTTARARAAVREMGGRTRGREGDVDQLAATVLLQTFLDHRR